MENGSTIKSSWPSLNDELNNDSGPKNVVNIKLRRDPATGLGFNIVGGSDQQHMPGRSDIFVSRIRSGTPAFASGEINPGDIIISINGKPLTDVTHQQAIDILKSDHGTVCELMVEQRAEKRILSDSTKFNPTTFDSDSISGMKNELKSILKQQSPAASVTLSGPPPASYAAAVKKNGTNSPTTPEPQFVQSRGDVAPNNGPIEPPQHETPFTSPPATNTSSSGDSSADRDSIITTSAGKRSRDVSMSSVTYADSVQNQKLVEERPEATEEEEMDERGSIISTTHSLLDDVPRTPKKPTARFLDPTNPSLSTELLFVSLGIVALVGIAYFGIRKYRSRN
ncbi:PDZ domain (Also known as DHR or GLGF) domain-containing protein [Ditylenchus destructor]|nr:PDZ domain (Also known as DHR or GLGF) domain-containing protein [Ditylenchus destructor]